MSRYPASFLVALEISCHMFYMQTRMNVLSSHIIVTATPCARTPVALTIVHAWMVTVVTVAFVPTLMNVQTAASPVTQTVKCVIGMLTVQIHRAIIAVNVKMDTLVMVLCVQVSQMTE